MAQIDVASFAQIATVLSQLATNYSSVFIDYYNLFYNPTPMDITIEIYDKDGNLEEITIPNRAKDRRYILNGNGDPEGNVDAAIGSLYQDLTNGTVYIKQFTTSDNTGWSELMTLGSLSNYIIHGMDSPEGVVTAVKGVMYIDKGTASLYIKSTEVGNTGWILSSVNASDLADTNLSNLTKDVGQNRFLWRSLGNIDNEGQLVLDRKEDVSNKTKVINSGSTDEQYPTAKAVYSLVGDGTSFLANKDLSNLTNSDNLVGNNYFVRTGTQVRDCIFKAPNLPSISGKIINVSSGTTILCANGVDSSTHASLKERVTLANDVNGTIPTGFIGKGVIFYSGGSLVFYHVEDYFRQNNDPDLINSTAIWYNPDENIYKTTTNSGANWSNIVAAEIGRFIIDEDGNVTHYEPYHPLTVATEEVLCVLVDKSSLVETVSIIYTYKAGTEWIRIWSDGWAEQGGAKAFMGNSGTAGNNKSIAFVYDFLDTTYTLMLSSSDVSGTDVAGSEISWGLKTLSGFQFGINQGYATDQVMNWYACGFLDMDKFNDAI